MLKPRFFEKISWYSFRIPLCALVACCIVMSFVGNLWAGCGGAWSLSDGIANEMLSGKTVYWVVHSSMDAGSVDKDSATNSCRASWGGDKMYQEGCDGGSEIVAFECAKFMLSGLTAMTGLERTWCCTTEITKNYVQSVLQSGSGDDSGGTGGEVNPSTGIDVSQAIAIACMESLDASGCQSAMGQLGALFGDFGAVLQCSSFGIAGNWCWINTVAAKLYANNMCYGNDYAYVYNRSFLKGGALLKVKADGTKVFSPTAALNITYNYVENAGKCICGEGTYGVSYFASGVTASPCVACPSVSGKTAETYDISLIDPGDALFASNVLQYGVPVTACNIQCTASSTCSDAYGKYRNPDGKACSYQQ